MISVPGKVQVYNFALLYANELYFLDMPENTAHFTIKARNKSTLKISFNDEVTYLTVPGGAGYYESNLKFNGMIGFQSSANNEVVEMVCWHGQA